MAELVFVGDKSNPQHRVWVCSELQRHWLQFYNEQIQADFLLGTWVVEGGRLEVFMSADIPIINPYEPTKLTSLHSCHRESDPFAALRAMLLLLKVVTSPGKPLLLEHVESAYSAGTRHAGQTKLPGSISKQSTFIIEAIGGADVHAEVMKSTIGGVEAATQQMVRNLGAWLSEDSYYREFEAELISLQALEACGPYLTESAKRHRNEPHTLTLFGSQDLAELAASHAIVADKRLREQET